MFARRCGRYRFTITAQECTLDRHSLLLWLAPAHPSATSVVLEPLFLQLSSKNMLDYPLLLPRSALAWFPNRLSPVYHQPRHVFLRDSPDRRAGQQSVSLLSAIHF